MSPTRRTFLAGVPTLAGLAGCVGGEDPGVTETTTGATAPSTTTGAPTTAASTGTATDATTASSTDAPTADGPVSVSTVSPQTSFFRITMVDWMDVLAPTDRQFVFTDVTATADGAVPSPDAFALTADGRRFDGWTRYDGERPFYVAGDGWTGYDEESASGWIGFDLPRPFEGDALSLAVGGHVDASGPLDDRVVAWLRDPPAIEVSNVRTPDRVAGDEPIEVRFDAGNVGGHAGVCRASLNSGGVNYLFEPIRLALDPGESTTHTRRYTGHVGHDTVETYVEVRAPGTHAERTIAIDR